MVAVLYENEDYRVVDDLNPTTEQKLKNVNLLKEFYNNGDFIFTNTFEEIRTRLANESKRVYG